MSSSSFTCRVQPTIGIDFRTRSLENGTRVNLFDIQGGFFYSKILRSYFRGSDGVLILYKINDRRTFKDALEVLDMIQEE